MTAVLLLVWVWLAMTVFVAGCAWRAWRYARAPVHLRWDLYPLPHEPAGRRAYGGSYLEEPGYWKLPRPRSLAGGLAVMLGEIVLLRGVWRHNRRLFWGSLPFHWGLYLLIATSFGLVLGAIVNGDSWVIALLPAVGAAGGTLLSAGALILLGVRWRDRGLARYTSPVDRMNLLMFCAVGALSAAVCLEPGGLSAVGAALPRMARFESAQPGALASTQMALAACVLLYLPFTRMIHFFAKFFLYHSVRWDDRPVSQGSVMERRLRAALDQTVTWSADHVGASRPWRDVVATGNADKGSGS